MRREVNAQHHLVHSDSASAIVCHAHDPALQLWVAVCMFRGVIDAVTQFRGPVDDEEFATLLSHCSRFATTLQVKANRVGRPTARNSRRTGTPRCARYGLTT